MNMSVIKDMIKKWIPYLGTGIFLVLVLCFAVHAWQMRWRSFSVYIPELKQSGVREVTLIRIGSDVAFPLQKKTRSPEEAACLLNGIKKLPVRRVDASLEEASAVEGGKDYVRLFFENGESLELVIYQYIGIAKEERFFQMKTDLFSDLWQSLPAKEEKISWEGLYKRLSDLYKYSAHYQPSKGGNVGRMERAVGYV